MEPDGPPLELVWHGTTDSRFAADGSSIAAALLWLDLDPAGSEAPTWGIHPIRGPRPRTGAGTALWPMAGSPKAPVRSSGQGFELMASPAGHLQLDRDAAGAIALVNEDGTAVGWTADGQRFETLAGVWRFLLQPGPRGLPFAEGLDAWQRTNPLHLLGEARQLLKASHRTQDEIRQLAQDMEVAAARIGGDLHRRLVDGITALAAQLVAEQPNDAMALAEARQWVGRYPDRVELVTLAIQAALNATAPEEALQWFDQLRALQPSAADKLLGPLLRGILAAGNSALAQGDAVRAEWFARAAIERSPGSAAARGLYAKALWALGRKSDASMAAAKAAELDPAYQGLAERYRAATAEVRSTAPGRVELPFDAAQGTVLAAVQVQGRTVQMVFDTGASLTTVPTRIAQAAGILPRNAKTVTINTAGGVVQAPRITIPELRIGTLVLRNVGAVALDLPGDLNSTGLLGLNAIGQLRVTIDRSRGKLILESL